MGMQIVSYSAVACYSTAGQGSLTTNSPRSPLFASNTEHYSIVGCHWALPNPKAGALIESSSNITQAPTRPRSGTSFPSPTHRYMSLKITVSIGKGIFLVLLLASLTTVYAACCAEPRVRREWRSISETERKEWLAAVKVGSNDPT